jgi:hypothetical protein
MTNPTPNPPLNPKSTIQNPKLAAHPPALYQIIIQCHAESQQRELYDRLRREGLKVRLLVL